MQRLLVGDDGGEGLRAREQETLAVLDKVKRHYDHDITLYRPQPEAVEQYVQQNGLNAFYDSVEMRRECCRIRKVEPLGRALADRKSVV